ISNGDDCVGVTQHLSLADEEEETTRPSAGNCGLRFVVDEMRSEEELAVEDDDLVGKALQKCAKISAELKRICTAPVYRGGNFFSRDCYS
ncbi:hypothetical protein OIU85_005839, partial [Salix viminalis]